MNEEDIIKLLPRRKRGLLKLVFSRIGLIMLLIILELGLLVSVYKWLSVYFKLFTAAQTVFAVGMILYLFNCGMDASGKLTWLFLIMLFPVPATILLWYTRKDVGHRMVKWRIQELTEETKQFSMQDEEVLTDLDLRESGIDDLCTYINKSGNYPIYRNTDVVYFSSGEAKFERLLIELEKAESFIFLEYFIIGEGYMWGRILNILAQKAKQGVDVRVMYDGMCEVTLLDHTYPQRMSQLGIKCKSFTPITPFLSTQYNYRDHRKILVIDGKVAFTGGVNLSDEYINREERFGHWKDAAIMVKGDAVQSFTLMFLQMWNLIEKEPDWSQVELKYSESIDDGFVMPYGDCPLDGERVGENVYIDMLYKAKTYAHIMTPYLILDNEMETAILFAAKRGVDVSIILPGIPDKKTAYALAKSHYRTLLSAGVKLYEYSPGFIHSKVFVSDDEKAVVGTINFDYRSLYHNFECAAFLYKTQCIHHIEQDFEQTILQCSEVTEETIKNKDKGYRILGGVLKIFAPLM